MSSALVAFGHGMPGGRTECRRAIFGLDSVGDHGLSPVAFLTMTASYPETIWGVKKPHRRIPAGLSSGC
jgi:hypothetical protein